MLQQNIYIKSRMFKEVQERNEKTTTVLKKATIDYAKLMQITIFCKEQSIPTDYFEPASQRFMKYWDRFFQNFVLHELYYEFSEAGDFALSVNFQRGQRGAKGEMSALKDKATELLVLCLREIDIGKSNHLDEKLTARQKKIDELELEFKTYREVSEQDLQEKNYHLERLQAKYQQMDQSLSSRQQQINDLEKDHVHFRQEAARNIQAKSNQLDILQGRYEQLTAELAARQQRINNIGRDHDIFRKQAEIDVASKNEQLTILQSRYDKLEVDLSFYEEKIKKIEKEHTLYRQQAEEEIKQKNAQVNVLQEKLTAKQRILDESNPSFNRYKEQAEEALLTKNHELAILEKKYQEITKDLTKRQQKVGKLESTLQAFEESAEDELSTKNQELTLLQSQFNQLTRELAKREEKISLIEQAQKAFSVESAQALQAKNQQLATLRKKIREASKDENPPLAISELESNHDVYRKQVRQDLLTKNEQLDGLHDKYQQMNQELSARQEKIDTLEDDYDTFKARIEEDIKAKNEQREKLQAMYDKIRLSNSAETSEPKRAPEPVIKQAPAQKKEATGEHVQQEPISEKMTLKKLAEVTTQGEKPVNKQGKAGTVTSDKPERKKAQELVSQPKTNEAIKTEPVATTEIVAEAKTQSKLADLVEQAEIQTPKPQSNQATVAKKVDASKIKRFSDVHLDADFRHLGESDKAQNKAASKVENMRERLKASVAEQGAGEVVMPSEGSRKLVKLPNTGTAAMDSKEQLENEIRNLFKQAHRGNQEKRAKIPKDDYYAYTTAIDFLDYQWSQATLHQDAKKRNIFLGWAQQYINHLPSFMEELEVNVRKPVFNKTSYLTNIHTLCMLKAYALLNQYLELHGEETN